MEFDGEAAAIAERFGAPAGLREAIAAFAWRVASEATVLLPVPSGASGDTWGSRSDLATDEVAPRTTSDALPERYEDLGVLGEGGMGRVHRVRDRVLGRVAALKVVSERIAVRPEAVARFVEEARVAAQLQHPNLLPVYDFGRLADGRPWFTMKEAKGRTLTSAIRDGWPLHRMVDVFAKVCDAVGYAHARGVLHRDVKPDNVMLGDHGEVLVLDWGLAKVVGRAEADVASTDDDDLSHSGDRVATRVGTVSGTVAYMAPEQARGEVDRLDPRTDVYALGAVLYEILAGRRPYAGATAAEALARVRVGPPESLPAEVPDELRALCERAMSREMSRRYANGAEVAAEARAWLEGARKREKALDVVALAHAADAEAAQLRTRAATLRAEGAALLEGVKPWEPEERKAPGWVKEDDAAALERGAALVEVRAEQLLHGALQHDPELPEAHVALVERAKAVHARAEESRDVDGASRAEVPMREHAERLPLGHPVRAACATYLRGDGALTLVTDPEGADVELFRYATRNRRLVPVHERSLGRTPLVEASMPMGSYLCLVQHRERADVRYPVAIGRGEHWDGVPPDAREPFPVVLPRPEELGPDDCHVPAGWFRAGDARLPDNPVRRVWCDAMVMRRFHVTNAEYLTFLDDLTMTGRETDALGFAPRERAGAAGEQGAMIYGRDGTGAFVLRADADGDQWDPEWPVVMVTWDGATAYALWSAARTRHRWRLPRELEWEKAARGVDGRAYPWGDAFDASWCCTRQSHAGRNLVRTLPVDESVYTVRGCAGNARDWCADAYAAPGPAISAGRPAKAAVDGGSNRVGRGGSWGSGPEFARVAYRDGLAPSLRTPSVSFRLARSFP